MKMNKRSLLIVLMVLNAVVLLGQIYPEGAPPFARTVNIIFLALSLFYFVSAIRKKKINRAVG